MASTKKLIKDYKTVVNKLKKQKTTLVIEEELLFDDEMNRLYGVAYTDYNIVKLEKNLSEKLRQAVLLHELIHLAFPQAKEREVLRAEKILADCMWKQNYRRIVI